jgi:predicted ATPase
MKTTEYFKDQVIRKRPYIKMEWVERAVKNPLKQESQEDGRIRYWIYVEEMGKYLRVVCLEDGETIHNAFPDRRFKGD